MKRLALLSLLAVAAFAQVTPTAPAISWFTPSDLRSPAPISAVQLNATASVPGTFVYTPPLGTVLSPGSNQTLTVAFSPTDTSLYTSATATVKINILGVWEPYADPIGVTVCQMDTTQTPPAPAIDEVTGLPRCFVVTQAVSTSMTQFLLTQTAGLGTDGKVAYKYASWWEYVVKFFINQMVLPVLDQFPPADLVTAKATAAAAAAAVDATKAAILAGQQ